MTKPTPDPERMSNTADVISYLLDQSPEDVRAALITDPEAAAITLAEARAMLAEANAAEPPSIAELLDRQANGWPVIPSDARDIDGDAR